MENLNFKSSVLMIVQLITFSKAIDFDEGCFIGEKAMLQLAITIDRTNTFIDGSNNSFYRQFAELTPTLFAEIEKVYPGSQFALSVHGDWERLAEPPVGGRGAHNQTEGCYTRLVEFTTDRVSYRRRMLNITSLGNGAQENGLSALAFMAADQNLGWIRNATAPNGKPVRRVLLLVTDEDDLLKLGAPNTPRRRGEFKGDGTDRCSQSRPPTHTKLRETFEKYQSTVIALLAVTKARPNVTELYQEHFQKIGGSTKYCGKPFVLKSKSKGILIPDMKSNFKVPEGFWSGEDIIGEAETADDSPKGLGLTNEDIQLLTAEQPTVKAGKYDELVKFVLDCLKQTDTGGACLFGDPEGFNTLGF